ncbi:hypothetical protein [Calidithermus chliarophilus]|uniref:recombination directionality factor n=1 Tax=Calidithermus chliarophilus TaxID=52023 RepID=UPI000429E1F0|nr:hypothetical protein [Calidithermus chliarophilus]
MIQGLNTRTRYVRIGKFKIGMKETVERGGRRFEKPTALDHFRIVDGAQPVQALYGEKPAQVLVYLPDNLSEATWDPYYKRYARSGLMCRGDGVVGQEVQADGSLKARDCALRGCPFAQPAKKGEKTEPAQCRPIGILSFKVVGVPSAGVYQIDIKGMSAVSRAEGYLRQLQQAAGGDLTGVPFLLTVNVSKGKDGFPTSRIELRDAPETLEALKDPWKRHAAGAATQRVQGFVITDAHGKVIASPEVGVEENIAIRARYALLLNEAIEKHYILGDAVEKYYQVLRTLERISEAEAQQAYERLKAYVDELEATQDEPVSRHGETDQRYAGFAFKYLRAADYEALGFEEPAEPGAMTRLQARKAMAYLYEQRKSKEAA